MTGNNGFRIGSRDLAAAPYHYKGCGLEDVYLLNGFTIEETDYGRGISIESIDELHRAIGLYVVAHKKRLSAQEFRFLRKQMNLTQNELAKGLGVDAQTIARYEKGETAISGPADHLIRFLYVFSIMPKERQLKFIEQIQALIEADEPVHNHPAWFKATDQGWVEAA